MTFPNPPEQPATFPPAPSGFGPPQQPGRLRGRTPRLLGWIFLGVAVVAFVVGGVVIGTKSLGKVNGFHRVTFSTGSGTVALNGTGKWVGYYEASNVDTSIDVIPDFRVKVTSPSGANVVPQRYGNRSDGKIKKLTYDYNGHKGVAAFQFTANRAGAYTIELQAVDSLPPGADIAVGRDIAGGTIVGGLLIVLGVLAAITATVLLIVGYVKRGRHKRELRAGAQFYGGPPPGYGGPPPGYGGPPPGYGGPPPPGYSGPPPPAYGGPPPPGYGEQPRFGEPPPAYGGPPPT